MDKTIKFIKKHCFTDEPHCGDYLSVCKGCNQKAWLIDDIKHKPDCEIGEVFKEIQQIVEVNDERKTLADDERSGFRNKTSNQKRRKRVSGTS